MKAALKAFEESVRLKPDWPEALTELGSKYSSFLQYDKAVVSLKKAIVLKPELAEAHKYLAIAYLYTGHYKDAIDDLLEAVHLKPSDALSHKLLGLAYLVLDERQKAAEEYVTLRALDTAMAEYLNNAIHDQNKPTFGLTTAKLISVPEPDYPITAQSKRIVGSVAVEVKIDQNGNVTSAKAVTGPAELYAAAEAAALKARFIPTKLSGSSVSVNAVITFKFEKQ